MEKLRTPSRTWLLAIVAIAVVATVIGMRRESDDALASAVRASLLLNDPVPLGVSPDGSQLLLRSSRGDRFRLLLRSTADGSERVLDDSARPQRGVAFRPDGQAIAFSVDGLEHDAPCEAFVVPITTARRQRIASADELLVNISWSPDARSIAMLALRDHGRRRDLSIHDGTAARSLGVELFERATYTWSPGGDALAIATADTTGTLLVVGLDGRERMRIALAAGAEVRGMSWSEPDRMVVAALVPGDEYVALYEIDLAARAIGHVIRDAADLSAPRMLPDGRVLASRNSDGQTSFVRCSFEDRTCAALGPTDGSAQGTRFSADRKAFYLIHSGQTTPAAILRFDLATTASTTLFRSADEPTLAVAPIRVDLISRDGLRVPTYVWKSPRPGSGGRAAIIRIHGGPDLQWSRSWDAGREMLLQAGFDIIDPNYRGSTGYGAAYENRGNEREGQIRDLEAACAYAHRALGVRFERIALLGDSYGTTLAPHVATSSECPAHSVVLLSTIDRGSSRRIGVRAPKRILAYQGEHDRVGPARARDVIKRVFTAAHLEQADYELTVMHGEAHTFTKLSSRVRIYRDLLRGFAGLSPLAEP
ncbi:MAG TPA: prolyl oligopeptidase family serine peptidase [Kofleriaceae bacterium]